MQLAMKPSPQPLKSFPKAFRAENCVQDMQGSTVWQWCGRANDYEQFCKNRFGAQWCWHCLHVSFYILAIFTKDVIGRHWLLCVTFHSCRQRQRKKRKEMRKEKRMRSRKKTRKKTRKIHERLSTPCLHASTSVRPEEEIYSLNLGLHIFGRMTVWGDYCIEI